MSYAEINIYNLNPENRDLLTTREKREKADLKDIELWAGYEGNLSVVFSGVIRNAFQSTPDGINWVDVSPPDTISEFTATADNLDAVGWSEPLDQWLAVGDYGRSMYSYNDGASWTYNEIEVSGSGITDRMQLRDAFWADSISKWVVAEGNPDSYDAIITSSDGINWTAVVSRDDSGGITFYNVTNYDPVQDIIITLGGSRYFTSQDGTNWTLRFLLSGFSACGLEFGGTHWLAMNTGQFGRRVYTSKNGTFWSIEDIGVQNSDYWYGGLAFGANRWVAVGFNRAGGGRGTIITRENKKLLPS